MGRKGEVNFRGKAFLRGAVRLLQQRRQFESAVRALYCLLRDSLIEPPQNL
jgi:hypothetical protein